VTKTCVILPPSFQAPCYTRSLTFLLLLCRYVPGTAYFFSPKRYRHAINPKNSSAYKPWLPSVDTNGYLRSVATLRLSYLPTCPRVAWAGAFAGGGAAADGHTWSVVVGDGGGGGDALALVGRNLDADRSPWEHAELAGRLEVRVEYRRPDTTQRGAARVDPWAPLARIFPSSDQNGRRPVAAPGDFTDDGTFGQRKQPVVVGVGALAEGAYELRLVATCAPVCAKEDKLCAAPLAPRVTRASKPALGAVQRAPAAADLDLIEALNVDYGDDADHAGPASASACATAGHAKTEALLETVRQIGIVLVLGVVVIVVLLLVVWKGQAGNAGDRGGAAAGAAAAC